MSKVQIPPVLRPSTGGARIVEAHGSTVGELLGDLYAQYPPLRDQLKTEQGLSSFINIYVNGEEVKTLQGIDTPIAEQDTVILLPAMAGG